jgi:hypothetical protein
MKPPFALRLLLAAVQELEAGLSTQAINCEVTPTCAE